MENRSLRLRIAVPGTLNETKEVDIISPDYVKSCDLAPHFLALGRTQRFGGLLRANLAYDNLRHSWLVSEIAVNIVEASGRSVSDGKLAAIAGLIHDLPEGFGLGDMVTPLKRVVTGAGDFEYAACHEQVEAALYERFNLPETVWLAGVVAEADRRATAAEQYVLRNVGKPSAEIALDAMTLLEVAETVFQRSPEELTALTLDFLDFLVTGKSAMLDEAAKAAKTPGPVFH